MHRKTSHGAQNFNIGWGSILGGDLSTRLRWQARLPAAIDCQCLLEQPAGTQNYANGKNRIACDYRISCPQAGILRTKSSKRSKRFASKFRGRESASDLKQSSGKLRTSDLRFIFEF
jgi:hypothetical protein